MLLGWGGENNGKTYSCSFYYRSYRNNIKCFFAYLACRRNLVKDEHTEAKNEGAILSDIGYIKACVDRVEKNLNKVDERYRNVVERLAKVEEAVANVIKRVDEL